MFFLLKYQKLLSKFIKLKKNNLEPKELYTPIKYFLSLKSKKIRPLMCLMACDLFLGNLKQALGPAVALEYFHNFTLIHDDIIDNAPLRRNQLTVHKKYNINTAILSGDVLLINAYKLFTKLPNKLYKKSIILFSNIAIQICEGQQMDINLNNQKKVSFNQYIKMIHYKTAILGAFSCKLGAIIANAKKHEIELLYQYGLNLGLAFQMMDDYLDVFGKKKYFGKQNYNDIYENKKTVLYFLALKNASKEEKKKINYYYSIKYKNINQILYIKNIFKQLNVDIEAMKLIHAYHNKSIMFLKKIKIYNTKNFFNLSNYLLKRET